MNRAGIALSAIAIGLALAPGARAADYWAYTYKDLDVTAEGTASEAQDVGRRLGAIDEALRKLLLLPGGASEPPTRVYALPQGELAGLDAVWSAQGGAFFRAGAFDDFLVLRSDGHAGEQELYAARVYALLASWGLARLPDWYRHGVALLLSSASFDQDHLTIGPDTGQRAARVAHDWIPMSQFLQLPAGDPVLHRSPDIEATYEAQCWWLAHLSLVDGLLDKVMPQYLQRLLMGESQQSAYVASFNIPYEQLDEYFKKVRRNFKLRPYNAVLPDAATLTSPQRLSASEIKARLAGLALVHEPRSEPGAKMAADALSTEPDNQRAMLALARHELGVKRYTQAQEGLGHLGEIENLSGESHRELAELLSTLLRFKDEGMPGTAGVDSKATRAAARMHFERAMTLAPNDPRAVYQLGWLLCGQGDVAAARELLPKVEAAFYRRPESVEFAELLVRMHSIVGNTAEEFKYAVAEQRLAATEAERARATARVERLRAQIKTAQ